VVNRLIPSINLDGVSLRVFPTIYKPLENEHRLVDWLQPDKTVLDIGCGSGVLAVFAAAISRHVTAIDINPAAIENTLLNCQRLGIKNVTAKVSNMFSAIDSRFDYIICYPPLYQLPFLKDHEQWATSSTFVKDLFENAPKYLNEGGRLVMLLPNWYRPSPETLAEKNGVRVVEKHDHAKRSLGLLIHSIPYFHVSMKHTIFEIAVGKSTPAKSIVKPTDCSEPIKPINGTPQAIH
jgi:methylase of polypeptide subunit release factors